MNPERAMKRRRRQVIARDLKLLKTYSMQDEDALKEMIELYMDTPIEKRQAQLKEIARYFRVTAVQINRHIYEQGGIN